MWKAIRNFFITLFTRKSRIELAVKVAKALKSLSDTSVDDIIEYILEVVVPSSATAISLIKSFLNKDLPTLLKALEIIDESDETSIEETNINAVITKVEEFVSNVDEEALTNAVKKAFDDGKITLTEAKDLLSNYINS